MNTLSKLKAGDVLLYRPHTLFGWVIALKTWCREACHVEVYVGGGQSVASRDGLGVGLYQTRLRGLSHVLRSRQINLGNAMDYFEQVRGQKYDWKGIMVFSLLAERGDDDKQICSEFARNFLKAAGSQCFNPDYPSEKVPPAMFLASPVLTEVFL